MISNKELRKKLYSEVISVPFRVADILILHAAGTMMDQRTSMAKIIHKNISPVAMKLLKERKELM